MAIASNVEEEVWAEQLADLLEAGGSFWVYINGDVSDKQSRRKAKWSRAK